MEYLKEHRPDVYPQIEEIIKGTSFNTAKRWVNGFWQGIELISFILKKKQKIIQTSPLPIWLRESLGKIAELLDLKWEETDSYGYKIVRSCPGCHSKIKVKEINGEVLNIESCGNYCAADYSMNEKVYFIREKQYSEEIVAIKIKR